MRRRQGLKKLLKTIKGDRLLLMKKKMNVEASWKKMMISPKSRRSNRVSVILEYTKTLA
jgi:hypothetical protein